MSTETLEAPPAAGPVSFDIALAGINFEDTAPATPETPAVETPAVETPPAETPPPVEKPEETPPASPGKFKQLKQEKDREKEEALAGLRTEYDAKIAELTGKVGEVDGLKEKLTAAEALKAAHEARVAELEERIVSDWEIPYSLEVDPDAMPVFAVIDTARSALDTAVNQAATSLGEDQRSVEIIASNKQLFAQVMAEMTKGLVPDAVHAGRLVEGLQKMGVTVPIEEARAAIRELKSVVPQLLTFGKAQNQLAEIRNRNEPTWTQTQAARHEAYRGFIKSAADVPETAEGDDAVLADILKGRPELKEALQAEADRLSALVIGPAPGKATASAIRATPKALHETAVRAARLPVMMAAYKASQADVAAKDARIAELEARLGADNGSVPKTGGNTAVATKTKVNFNEALAEIFPDR